MKNFKAVLVIQMIIVMFCVAHSHASGSVDWSIQKTMQFNAVPLDVAVSPDGGRFFVLTDQGEIFIYSSTSKLQGKMDVGEHVDKIQLSPKGDLLLLNSRKNKTVQVIALDFVHDINIAGSPFKGNEDAPVVVAVFSDFQ